MAGAHLSKDFFDLIKAVGEAKSKQEEDRIIQIETAVLKKLLADRTSPLTGKRLKASAPCGGSAARGRRGGAAS